MELKESLKLFLPSLFERLHGAGGSGASSAKNAEGGTDGAGDSAVSAQGDSAGVGEYDIPIRIFPAEDPEPRLVRRFSAYSCAFWWRRCILGGGLVTSGSWRFTRCLRVWFKLVTTKPQHKNVCVISAKGGNQSSFCLVKSRVR